MFQPVYALTFHRPMNIGKTQPCLIDCIDQNNQSHEVIAKFSQNCEQKEFTLIIEAIASFLAADLNLPIPEPKLVNISAEFASTLPSTYIRVSSKSFYAFGSSRLPSSYRIFTNPVASFTPEQMQAASEIFAFDMVIKNPDRRISNPNCLTNGVSFAIFDHDLSLRPKLLSFDLEPWEPDFLETWNYEEHIFYKSLKQKTEFINLEPFSDAWKAIDDKRLQAYQNALPFEWLKGNEENTEKILSLVANIRNNIDPALSEVLRVLK